MTYEITLVRPTEYAKEMSRLGLVHENEEMCTYTREVEAKSETQAVMQLMAEIWKGGVHDQPIVYEIASYPHRNSDRFKLD